MRLYFSALGCLLTLTCCAETFSEQERWINQQKKLKNYAAMLTRAYEDTRPLTTKARAIIDKMEQAQQDPTTNSGDVAKITQQAIELQQMVDSIRRAFEAIQSYKEVRRETGNRELSPEIKAVVEAADKIIANMDKPQETAKPEPLPVDADKEARKKAAEEQRARLLKEAQDKK